MQEQEKSKTTTVQVSLEIREKLRIFSDWLSEELPEKDWGVRWDVDNTVRKLLDYANAWKDQKFLELKRLETDNHHLRKDLANEILRSGRIAEVAESLAFLTAVSLQVQKNLGIDDDKITEAMEEISKAAIREDAEQIFRDVYASVVQVFGDHETRDDLEITSHKNYLELVEFLSAHNQKRTAGAFYREYVEND